MNRQPYQTPPQWWSPKLSAAWVRFWGPWRKRKQLRVQRLIEVDVRGIEHVRQAVDRGQGVLITANHAGHADCYTLYGAAEKLGCPVYVMVAWQVFERSSRIVRLVMRHHGCFSVDREGADMRAFRQAVDVIESQPHPLFIFPEGEVYHVSERATPFREGPAAMAMLAARKGKRPVVCIPCGLKYHYVEDPTPDLLRLMDDLERAIFWRPRPDLSLPERIYHFAEGALALKEIEYLGHSCGGPLPERVANLVDFILGCLEARYGLGHTGLTVPERVKAVRQAAIHRLEELPENDPQRRQCGEDLDDVFLAVQLFSYPGNYVAEQPSIERIAETLDKFEEDVLGASTAAIRGARKATIVFGEPIPVDPARGKGAAAALTQLLEQRVQALMDGIEAPAGRSFAAVTPQRKTPSAATA
jgi:hypothetical protein